MGFEELILIVCICVRFVLLLTRESICNGMCGGVFEYYGDNAFEQCGEGMFSVHAFVKGACIRFILLLIRVCMRWVFGRVCIE